LNSEYYLGNEIVIKKELKNPETELYFNHERIDNFQLTHFVLTNCGVFYSN